MRSTIRIDDELYREVKQRAARSGRTVAAVLEDAVRRGLTPSERRSAGRYTIRPIGSGGLRRPGLCSVPTGVVSAHGCAGLTGCRTSKACVRSRAAVVASHFAHFGEENCLRGWNGSGTIFFSGCNLRCVFCQNHDISWQVRGERVTPRRLAQMMVELQDSGTWY